MLCVCTAAVAACRYVTAPHYALALRRVLRPLPYQYSSAPHTFFILILSALYTMPLLLHYAITCIYFVPCFMLHILLRYTYLLCLLCHTGVRPSLAFSIIFSIYLVRLCYSLCTSLLDTFSIPFAPLIPSHYVVDTGAFIH